MPLMKGSKVSDVEPLPPRQQNELGDNKIFTDEPATSDLLSSARKEMYDALRLFQDHVKHLLTLMFSVMTAVFAVLGLSIKEDKSMSRKLWVRFFHCFES